MHEHEQDTTDVLILVSEKQEIFGSKLPPLSACSAKVGSSSRGPKVNAKRNWDGNWILENAKTKKPLLIGTKEQILEEYDRRNETTI